MNGCGLIGFDLRQCAAATVFGWVPDWAWPLMTYWPWLVGLVVVGLTWRFSGWPGLLALGAAVGFLAGRRSVRPVSTPPAVPAKPPQLRTPRRKVGRPTIFDGWR